MMIVISGTISRGRTPLSGWWNAPDTCDCSARASSCSASIEEPWISFASSSISKPKAAISAANARKPRPTSICRILISAIILSVRQSTRRFLTTFSVFTLVSPQHETDDDAERECRSERRDRAIRNKILDMAFFLAQGFAEIVQCCFDLICERLGAVPGGVEDSFACGVQQARHITFERLQLISQLTWVEHRSHLRCIIQSKLYASPRFGY